MINTVVFLDHNNKVTPSALLQTQEERLEDQSYIYVCKK
jgi:hypothetical protein